MRRYVYWKGSHGPRQKGHREEAALWDLGRELTIRHTRRDVLSLIVSASIEITGTLSRRLGWLALQHVDYVHTVDTLQSCVQALHYRECVKEEHKMTRKKRKRGRVPRTNSNTITNNNNKEGMRKIHTKLRSYILTLGPLALTGGPQVKQCRALLQQRVGILHADLIDVIHAELKLARQLCIENESEEIK